MKRQLVEHDEDVRRLSEQISSVQTILTEAKTEEAQPVADLVKKIEAALKGEEHHQLNFQQQSQHLVLGTEVSENREAPAGLASQERQVLKLSQSFLLLFAHSDLH